MWRIKYVVFITQSMNSFMRGPPILKLEYLFAIFRIYFSLTYQVTILTQYVLCENTIRIAVFLLLLMYAIDKYVCIIQWYNIFACGIFLIRIESIKSHMYCVMYTCVLIRVSIAISIRLASLKDFRSAVQKNKYARTFLLSVQFIVEPV